MSSHVPSLILNLFIAAFLSPGGVPVPLRRSSPLTTFLFLTALVSPMVVFLCFPRGAAPFSCGAICSLVVPLSFFAVLPFSLPCGVPLSIVGLLRCSSRRHPFPRGAALKFSWSRSLCLRRRLLFCAELLCFLAAFLPFFAAFLYFFAGFLSF